MGVDLLTSKFPKRIQLYISLFSHVVCIGFQIFIIIYGYALCVTGSKRVIASLDCSYSLISTSLVVGMVLMLLAEIEYLIKDIHLLLHSNKEVLG
jgi:TRAP-type C4-dicarboxylate transport system permease small subunit